MISPSLLRAAAVALLIPVLGLTACSRSKQDQADNARAQLQQANQNLEQAQKNLAQAQQQAADARASAKKKEAQKKLAEAKQDRARARQKHSEAKQASEHKTAQARSHSKPVCSDCGTISSITPIQRNAQHGSGVGAVAGGVAGGAIGSQIGHGAGKTIAEIAGALGGAYAGNAAEKHIRKITVYRVDVAMDTGGARSVTLDSVNGLSAGTRVRVDGNNLAPLR
ncbi:glycine zipper 2TM domain-containing protein [Salinisphaera sp. RV14]|uniref:glycine zipper 2TM domain-containing protein n=1 Tax=unclassified Salinisphaera TaxID=2649847 RepID=UPI003F87DD8C